jgi:hypothetical protein
MFTIIFKVTEKKGEGRPERFEEPFRAFELPLRLVRASESTRV